MLMVTGDKVAMPASWLAPTGTAEGSIWTTMMTMMTTTEDQNA